MKITIGKARELAAWLDGMTCKSDYYFGVVEGLQRAGVRVNWVDRADDRRHYVEGVNADSIKPGMRRTRSVRPRK